MASRYDLLGRALERLGFGFDQSTLIRVGLVGRDPPQRRGLIEKDRTPPPLVLAVVPSASDHHGGPA